MPVYIPQHKAVFIHIPKTGGTTVSKFLFQEFGKHIQTLNGHKTGHIKTRYVEKELFKFAFVRNPIDWWESVWKMLGAMSKEQFWNGAGFQPLGIIAPLYDKDFNKFMTNVIRFVPGFYSEMLTWYLGKNYDGLDFVGRTRYLKTDLKEVLNKIGHEFDYNKLKNFPNFGGGKRTIVWEKKIENEIIKLEDRYYRKFRLK